MEEENFEDFDEDEIKQIIANGLYYLECDAGF